MNKFDFIWSIYFGKISLEFPDWSAYDCFENCVTIRLFRLKFGLHVIIFGYIIIMTALVECLVRKLVISTVFWVLASCKTAKVSSNSEWIIYFHFIQNKFVWSNKDVLILHYILTVSPRIHHHLIDHTNWLLI